MIAGEIKFGVSLTDGISPSSRAASASLRQLQLQLKSAKTLLSAYQGQLTKANAIGDIEGHRRYSALVEESRRHVFDLSRATEEASGGVTTLGQKMTLTGGPIGFVAEAAAVGASALYGMARATESLIEKAASVTSENRRLSASFEALGGKGAGAPTLAFVDDLAARLPQSRKEIAGWVSEVQAMGITDLGQIRTQVLALASAQASTFASGGQGAEVYAKLAERIHVAVEEHKGLKLADKQLKTLYQSGLNVTEIATAMGLTTQQLAAQLKAGTVDAQRFGDVLQQTLIAKGREPLKAMGSDLGTLKLKASENIGHLFDDVDTTPLTDGLRMAVDLLGQGTASGKTLKAALTDALNAIIKGIGRTMWEAEMFFGRLEIWALESGVTLGKVENVVSRIGSAFSAVAKGSVALGASAITPINPLAGLVTAGATSSAGRSLANTIAPAHQEGGLVQRPAMGEYMASVEPGEMILPRRLTDLLRSSTAATPPNDNAPSAGSSYTIERLELNITAPQGVTDAKAISVTGLATALERLQLAGGR